jgi:hypothetical protein
MKQRCQSIRTVNVLTVHLSRKIFSDQLKNENIARSLYNIVFQCRLSTTSDGVLSLSRSLNTFSNMRFNCLDVYKSYRCCNPAIVHGRNKTFQCCFFSWRLLFQYHHDSSIQLYVELLGCKHYPFCA